MTVRSDPFTPIASSDFVQLANACGLESDETLLEQLRRRHLLSPVIDDDYVPIQLYALALYFDAVTVHRHPWSPSGSDRSIDDVQKTSRRIEKLVDADEPSSEALSSFALEMERYLNSIDPFGPVAAVVDFLRDDVREQLRGVGRLYVELRVLAATMAEETEEEPETPETGPVPELEEPAGADEPVTAEEDAGEPGEEGPRRTVEISQKDLEETAPAGARTLDESSASEPEEDETPTEVVAPEPDNDRRPETEDEAEAEKESAPGRESEAKEDSDAKEEAEAEEAEEAEEEEAAAEEEADAAEEEAEADDDSEAAADEGSEGEARPEQKTQRIQLDTERVQRAISEQHPGKQKGVASPDNAEAPPEEDDEEDIPMPSRRPSTGTSSTFKRDRQPATEPSKDLETRLQDLGEGGFSRDKVRGKDQSTAERESLKSRIEELNRLRQKYISEQNWSGLIELYEDGIELFEDPAERQQVFLTLATLYEAKKKQPREAFAYFERALDEGADGGRSKALAGLQRLGRTESLQGRYSEWIEERLRSDDISAEERQTLKQEFALALNAQGEDHRAFLTYAAFLTEDPAGRVNEESLDTIERLSANLDDEDLDGFFEDILEQSPPRAVATLVGNRAGTYHVERGQTFQAMRAFRIALDADPGDRVAFDNLCRILEDEGEWAEVVQLIEGRLKRVAGSERARLREELAHAVDEEIAADESSFGTYRERLKDDPTDDIALDRFIRSLWAHRRFAEGYAFLNQLLEKLADGVPASRVLQSMGDISVRHLHAPQEAAMHYRNALEMGGSPDELLPKLAEVEFDIGAWGGAASHIKRLVERDADLSQEDRLEWLARGLEAARKDGNQELAQEFRSRLRTLNTDGETASG